MKIVRIKLTVAQMAILLLIDKEYEFGLEVENQIVGIKKKYPDGISNDCQDVFEILVPTDEVEETFLTINEAANDNDLSKNREEIVSFESALYDIIRDAEVESISNICRIVVILGDLKLSDGLLQKLRKQKIEVITAQTAQAVENMVSKKKDANLGVELLFLLVVAENCDNRLIEDVHYILLDSAEKEIIVCKMVGDDIPSKRPYPIDMYIKNENEIDFSSLDVAIESGDMKEVEEKKDNNDEDRYYW